MKAPEFTIPELLAFITGAVLLWFLFRQWQERVFIENDNLIRKVNWQRESMPIAAIREIRYHYHAVVGFIAVWEFIDSERHIFSVESDTRGLEAVFAQLSEQLPGFSLDNFEQLFREGDVVDTLPIWSRANHAVANTPTTATSSVANTERN